MLKRRENVKTDLPLPAFQKFNENIFLDESIPPDTFTPLEDAKGNHIAPAEL
jgi:hypothetical protein